MGNLGLQVKKHMTMDEFVRNNRGIDNGKDLPRELLEAVYNNIKEKKVRGVASRPMVLTGLGVVH